MRSMAIWQIKHLEVDGERKVYEEYLSVWHLRYDITQVRPLYILVYEILYIPVQYAEYCAICHGPNIYRPSNMRINPQ